MPFVEVLNQTKPNSFIGSDRSAEPADEQRGGERAHWRKRGGAPAIVPAPTLLWAWDHARAHTGHLRFSQYSY